MPLGVVYTKSRSIWSDINPFLKQLGDAYVKSQETKWNNEWQLTAIADIEKANKPQEVTDFLEMQKIPKENLNLEKFKGFANDAMNLLTQKEMAMSPEDFQAQPGVKPVSQVSPTQTKIMPDVKEFNELYKFVSELPTGKVDWADTLNVFKKKLESGRAIGSAGQQFLSMIMGQSMPTNQRQEVQQDFEFTKDIHETLYPGEKAPTSDYERYKQDPEGFAAFKAVGKEPKVTFDYESFLKDNLGWQIDTIDSKGTVRVKRKDTTKKYDFKTWKEANDWTTANPQKGFDWKIDPQPEGFNVSAVKKTVTPQGGTGKLIPTFGTINSINEALLNPGNDYDTELHNAEIKYNLEGVKLTSKADQAKNAYDMFEGIILHEDNEYIDEKGMVKDEEAYMDYYRDYERFAEAYFRETGTILPKKYLSVEEAGKYTTLQWAAGKAKGGNRPVRNEDNIPWSWQGDVDATQEFYNEMQRTDTKIEDVNLERLGKETEVDVDKLLQMCSP